MYIGSKENVEVNFLFEPIVFPTNQRIISNFISGKYHCMADLLFDWFRFSRFDYIVINNRFTCLVENKPALQEVRRSVILPFAK